MPSTNSVLSPLPTRSEYLSTLPLWRRCLAMLNWRPVYAIEQQTRLHEISSLASEKLMLASEKRLLDSERRTRQLESEIALLKESNARIARYERELFSCSNPVPSTDDSSPS
jgi:hypothetical protein